MSASRGLEDLQWLPEAPDDFDDRCRTFARASAGTDADLRFLASFSLDTVNSAALARAMAKRISLGDVFSEFTHVKLAILAAWTTDYIADCLPAAAARHNVLTRLAVANYDQLIQDVLDPGSAIYVDPPDLGLVLVDFRWMQLDQPGFADGDLEATRRVERGMDKLRSVISAFRRSSRAPVILSTIATPVAALFGSFDRLQSGSLRDLVDRTNREIVKLARETGGYLLDVAAIAETMGTERWFDPRQWNAYKLPFAANVTPYLADCVGRLLAAIFGQSKKCLVLDLDNTLWGGVIGDDGLAGIKIGQGSAAGEAFLAVQKVALELKSRGIILAVCSKNYEENARLPFQQHPDMLLREDDISVFAANWTDKPSNLRVIAKTLNIGLASLVFLDDNPAERGQVRMALPMVGVPEIGNDPSTYADTLMAAGYFEAVSFSADDRLRIASYAMDKERSALQESLGVGDYLTSLGMELSIGAIDPMNRQRVTQLINKTNQFNLTTRRYTEAEVQAAEENDTFCTLQARLRDRFGDLGLIAVVIARKAMVADEPSLVVDTWLMSCRVLARRVEEAMLGALVSGGKRLGATAIYGRFIPTAKNGMVADLYPRLGFEATAAEGDGAVFRLAIASYHRPQDLPFARSSAFAVVA